MAFFYVKVHNPPSVGEQSLQAKSDQEYVYVNERFHIPFLILSFSYSYIEDGFVTIGAFLEKIKKNFQKIFGSEVNVVQGENIPTSVSDRCVLCIHNLTPVKKVDPTWEVRDAIAMFRRV